MKGLSNTTKLNDKNIKLWECISMGNIADSRLDMYGKINIYIKHFKG